MFNLTLDSAGICFFAPEYDGFTSIIQLVGGFNLFEKYWSNWIISRENKKSLSCHHLVQVVLELNDHPPVISSSS